MHNNFLSTSASISITKVSLIWSDLSYLSLDEMVGICLIASLEENKAE